MAKTPPYFLDGEGITREHFLGLDSPGRVRAMRDWFFDMYEDPAQETPYNSREGGYQYIWGGPFDAQEELYSNFSNEASDDEIQAAVQSIEEDGITDWAPRHPETEDEDFDADLNDRGADQDFNDAPPSYPSEEEMERLRQRTLVSLDRVDYLLEQERARLLRMHNLPPEMIEDDPLVPEDALVAIAQQVAESKGLVQTPQPDQAALIEKTSIFRKIADWIRRHPVAATIGSAIAGGPLGNLGQFLWDETGAQVISHRHEIYQALLQAAEAMGAWAQHLLPL